MIHFTGAPPQNGDDRHVELLAIRLLGKVRFGEHTYAQLLSFCYYTMLNNRISYLVRSHRRVSCVTHHGDYMAHIYFLR